MLERRVLPKPKPLTEEEKQSWIAKQRLADKLYLERIQIRKAAHQEWWRCKCFDVPQVRCERHTSCTI